MLEAAVTDAVSGDWEDRTLLGWFLALPLVLAIPAIRYVDVRIAAAVALLSIVLLAGYGRRVLVRSVADPSLPAVEDWHALGRSALVGSALTVVLVVLPTGLAAVALWADASPLTAAVSELTAAALVVVAFVAGTYVLPAALAVSGRDPTAERPDRTGTPRAAVRRIVVSRDYVVATLQAVLLAFTLGAITLMLLVTVFGLVLLPAAVFLVVVVVSRRYAYAVDRVLDPATIDGLDERTMDWL